MQPPPSMDRRASRQALELVEAYVGLQERMLQLHHHAYQGLAALWHGGVHFIGRLQDPLELFGDMKAVSTPPNSKLQSLIDADLGLFKSLTEHCEAAPLSLQKKVRVPANPFLSAAYPLQSGA